MALALVAAVVLVACTDDDDAAPEATSSPTVAVGSLPSSPTPSAPATSAPAALPSTALAVPVPTAAAGATWTPTAVAGPAADHPWLVVGTGRAGPGEPSRVALARSDDGATWQQWALVGPDDATATAIAERPDGTTVIGGSVDAATGPQPTLWRLADDGVEPSDVVAGVTGTVTGIAVDGAGNEVLLLVTADAGPAVATRNGAHGWRTADLPDAGGATAAGIAAAGSTVVVTGTTAAGSEGPAHAVAWRSVDGGATFAPADTSTLTTPDQATGLGPVVANGSGFAAASCSPDPGGARGGLAFSADGATWADLPFHHPRGVVPVVGGGCATTAADPDGGIWLASGDRAPDVFRVSVDLVDRLGVLSRPAGTLFEGPPLVAVSDGTVVVVTPQPGGAASTSAPSATLATDLELDVAMPATSGLPAGHESPVGVVPLDDRGTTIGLATYPIVTDGADGSYRWTTHVTAHRLAGREIVAAPDEAPVGPDGSLGGIVTTTAGQVALATVVDADLDAGAAGPIGDVVVSRRPDGGSWSAREVIDGGAGRQAIEAVAASGDIVVGVGEEQLVDPGTGATTTAPLVLAGDGTTFTRVAVDGAPEGLSLSGVCPGPDGTVVAVGSGPSGSTVVSVDPTAATASVLPAGAVPAGAAPEHCAGDGRAVLLAGPGALLASTDATTFRPVPGLGVGDTVTAVAAGVDGFAVAGSTAGGDGFVLAGADPSTLQALDAPLLTGVGEHDPTGVIVRAHDVLVLGLGDGGPVVWPVPR